MRLGNKDFLYCKKLLNLMSVSAARIGIITLKNGTSYNGTLECGFTYDCPNNTLTKLPYQPLFQVVEGQHPVNNPEDVMRMTPCELETADENLYGIISFPKSDPRKSYTGEFDEKNLFRGYGKLRWRNGDCFVGDWLSGQQDGNGTFIYSEDSDLQRYTGDWKNGSMSGNGSLEWKNENQYIGEFQGGQMTGNGKFYWPNGQIYTGKFT